VKKKSKKHIGKNITPNSNKESWDMFFASLTKFSDDFMNIRKQPELQKRHKTKFAKGKSS
jgi:virulence-associated protein VagC